MTAQLDTLIINPGALSVDDLRIAYRRPIQVELNAECVAGIDAARRVVASVVERGETVYGVNTGFGLLANKRIPEQDLEELQRRLVVSHACGVGELLPDDQVGLILLLKIASLARGHSGVRLALIEALIRLLNAGVYPCIPSQGSVGASGDLAPLAHLSLPLIGEGEVRIEGERLPGVKGLAHAGIEPLVLAPKEGLALLNGTQVSTAMALAALFQGERLFNAAMVAGSLSIDAALGSDSPFDARIQQVRGQPGQEDTAAVYRSLLAGSEIRHSHENCERVQDPYSLRCQPQVMGSCLDNLRHAGRTLLIEANAVSDNPLVFAETNEILSGGNFHAEFVAQVADLIAIAFAEVGALSERRIALLIDSHQSELPPFLVNDSGVNSGFMIAQVTAAALASENKSLAHPASVDSLPTSANQEDHVSMAAFAARRLMSIVENTSGVVAIEILAACQGIDLRAPLTTSDPLKAVIAIIRERVPPYDEDRYFAPDIEAVKALIASGNLATAEDLALF